MGLFNPKNRYQSVAHLYLLLLALYVLCRVVFFVANIEAWRGASAGQVVWAFLFGLRYDTSAIATVNILYLTLVLLPLPPKRWWRTTLGGLFVGGNFAFLALNIGDAEYFKYAGRRTNFGILRMTDDMGGHIFQWLASFWWLLLLGLAMGAALWWAHRRLNATGGWGLPRWPYALLFWALCIGADIGLIRNSVQEIPLMTGHAFHIEPAVLGNLSLNTPFVFFKTVDKEPPARPQFFKDKAVVDKVLWRPAPGQDSCRRDNVVIIILESFATEFTGLEDAGEPSYTPFFDSLARAGVHFRNHFAAGTRSIDAVPAILASIPALTEEPLISSSFQTNRVYGLGGALKAAGYHTSFFHGGKNGTMGFDYFSAMAGFEHYHGLYQYGDMRDFDGGWGIYDEPFLQYMAGKLTSFPQPFAAGVFTLSSHQPYAIEEKYAGRFPKGTLPIHESLGYADNALRKFFEAAKKTPWYANTLFVLTADHTQMKRRPRYLTDAGAFDVPLVLFHPTRPLNVPDAARTAQHTDIPPTVLDFVGVRPQQCMRFGRSLLKPGPGEALLFLQGHFYYLRDSLLARYSPEHGFDPERPLDLKTYETGPPRPDDTTRRFAQAYIQYYFDGLLDNDWLRPCAAPVGGPQARAPDF